MFCAKCGAPLNGASFCASCGTAAIQTSAAPVQPVPTNYQAPNQAPYPAPYGAPAPTNGLAVGGFVTSLICLGPVGFVLSAIALNQIKKSPTPQGGKGLAIAGVVIGGLSILYLLGVVLMGITASNYYYNMSRAFLEQFSIVNIKLRNYYEFELLLTV